MDDEQVSREIVEIEHGLEHDDPAFVHGMRRLRRTEATYVLIVGSLLAVGAVLLTIGFATLSWPTWLAGALTLLASLIADHCYHHTLR